MKPITKFVIAAFAATALIPATAISAAPDNKGYLVAKDVGLIVRNGYGECWQHLDADVPAVQPSCYPVAPAAAAPAPAPVVVASAPPAPPAPVPFSQKISFSGDALFAFDKSELKPEGKAMLDGLVRDLSSATYDTIALTGHTDRFGSNAYNQKLSERRAQTVKSYLLSMNVKTNGMTAEGKGETQHETKPGDCPGAKATASVKACLQTDRRVDVEMTGTKIIVGSR